MIPGWAAASAPATRSGRRIALAYLLLLAFVAVVAVVVFRAGADRQPAAAVGGVYRLDQSPPCLGDIAGDAARSSSRASSSAWTAPATLAASCACAGHGWTGQVTCRDGHGTRVDVAGRRDHRFRPGRRRRS